LEQFSDARRKDLEVVSGRYRPYSECRRAAHECSSTEGSVDCSAEEFPRRIRARICQSVQRLKPIQLRRQTQSYGFLHRYQWWQRCNSDKPVIYALRTVAAVDDGSGQRRRCRLQLDYTEPI